MSTFVQVHRSLLIEQTLLNTHPVTVNDLFLLSIGESCPKLINLYFFYFSIFLSKTTKKLWRTNTRLLYTRHFLHKLFLKKKFFCKNKASLQFLSERTHVFLFYLPILPRSSRTKRNLKYWSRDYSTYLAYNVPSIYTYFVLTEHLRTLLYFGLLHFPCMWFSRGVMTSEE